jgi:hypothetical protein
MPSGRLSTAALLILPLAAPAQDNTVKRLMLDRIHPAANSILLASSRGSSKWAELAASAQALQQSAAELSSKNPQPDWSSAAAQLAGAAADAEKAALAKNDTALPAIARRIDASCTTRHRRYRPTVFPPPGKGVE